MEFGDGDRIWTLFLVHWGLIVSDYFPELDDSSATSITQ